MYKEGNGINSNTYDLLLESDHFKIRKPKSAQEEALKFIECFTLFTDEEEEKWLDNSNDIIEMDGFYRYRIGRRIYTFNRMDKYANPVDAAKLRTKDRYGLCCPESIKMAKERKSGNVRIGYIHYTEKKVVHAVYEDNGVIYDYTKNLLMLEDEYYNLTKFEEINVISSKEIISDYEYIHAFGSIPLKLYLLYRDEIMKDLKKNSKVLKVTKNGKKRSK